MKNYSPKNMLFQRNFGLVFQFEIFLANSMRCLLLTLFPLRIALPYLCSLLKQLLRTDRCLTYSEALEVLDEQRCCLGEVLCIRAMCRCFYTLNGVAERHKNPLH